MPFIHCSHDTIANCYILYPLIPMTHQALPQLSFDIESIDALVFDVLIAMLSECDIYYILSCTIAM